VHNKLFKTINKLLIGECMPIGPLEILLIVFIILILFGPKRLPQLARALGEAVREYKKGLEEGKGSKKRKKKKSKRSKLAG